MCVCRGGGGGRGGVIIYADLLQIWTAAEPPYSTLHEIYM